MTAPLPEPLMLNGEPHYTADQIAGMRLPGLPITEEGVRKKALSESWARLSCPSGHVGGVVYPLEALPDEAVENMRKKHIFLVLGADQRARVEAKVEAVRQWRSYKRKASKEMSIGDAHEAFRILWKTGRAGAEERTYKALPSFSSPSLYRWDRALKKGGPNTLADQRVQPREGLGILGADAKMHKSLLGVLAASVPIPERFLESFLELGAGRDHEIASALLKAVRLTIKSQEES